MAVQAVVAPPVRQARLGGIRSVATWVTNARIGAAEAVAYVSNGCTFPKPAIGLCYGEDVVTEKTGEAIDTYYGIGEPFALYGGVECFLGPDGDFPERAQRILIEGEDREIEDRLSNWASIGADVGPEADIINAIAAVEDHADRNYLGRPILLLHRGDAIRAAAAGAIEPGLNGESTTINGTPVVSSGEVPEGTVQMVGAVTVLRTDVENIDTVNFRVNTEWAVAEAVYTILVDCDYRSFAEIGTP